MTSFCHDQYEHPLLWCDNKRRAVERHDAIHSIEEVQQRKEYKKSKLISDQNEYREMIVKHCPWGRPGGGAPGEHIRRGNILVQGLFPDSSGNDCRKFTLPHHSKTFKAGGGGAPLRNASGKIVTYFRDDPNISFTFNESNRNHVNNELRYKTSASSKMQYKMQLDKMVAEKDKAARRRSSVVSKHDPWGKAGPGGALWRDPSTINQGPKFMKSMGWTDKRTMQGMDRETTGVVATKKQEEPISTNKCGSSSTMFPMMCCCTKCCCNCGTKFGDPNVPGSPKAKTTLDSGNKTEQMMKKMRNNQHQRNNDKNSRARMCMISGGVELVPLLARRRAMQRPFSLSTTDVTKCPNANKFEEEGHLSGLYRQIEQKERRQQINKEFELDASQRHFETFDSLWGRPGNGAPMPIKTKLNLNDLLYKVPFKAECVL